MKKISSEEIHERVRQENPWWTPPPAIPDVYSKWTPRPYLDLLAELVTQVAIRRAVVLMGPRRVGKTVMIHHMINRLLQAGISPKQVCYFSVDHPIYNEMSLQSFIRSYEKAVEVDITKDPCYVFFDEIQYLRDWEKHLKAIVDTYPLLRCLVSGSAAAALKLKSKESGAGRFTDFLLPPLTFHEYLFLLKETNIVDIEDKSGETQFNTSNIDRLNKHFIDYLNFGGYPEVVSSPEIRSDPRRFIKSDIIDKVLLRDLPQLYGIHDIQELNHLFTTLAFNTAGEISLNELSQGSGVAKNTIKKYIEYLETAFLVKTVHRVDRSAKRFMRANYFKVYLTNPSIRAALFSPIQSTDSAMGSLVETAIFAQWFHQEMPLYYARWKHGEVDIVQVSDERKASWAVEAKWSNRYYEHPEELQSLVQFCHTQGLKSALITTQTLTGTREIEGITFDYKPAGLYCYFLGYNIVKHKIRRPGQYDE